MESNSNSNYNSLQATLNKRFSHGLQMLLSYTLSHSIDDYSGSDVSDITLLPGDMVNEQHNYASSDFDRRHRFVASYLYNLPDAYHGGSAFAKKLLNSWSVSGIVTLQSGVPFSIYGQDAAFEATMADLKPGRTLQSAIKGGNVADRLGNNKTNPNPYFDTSAFVQPATIGDPVRAVRKEHHPRTETDRHRLLHHQVHPGHGKPTGGVPGRVLQSVQ